MVEWCLKYKVVKRCSTTKARAAVMSLSRGEVETPVFMPVGTQGTMKGITTEQLRQIDFHIILANTYHLAHEPGTEVLEHYGGIHQFMDWDRPLLTDSGGFQMVSLVHLTTLSEEGVEFAYPHDQSIKLMMSPEESMRIQKSINSDIVMQLDDVVSAGIGRGPRIEEAAERSVRWLDRCLAVEMGPNQNIFPIVQGGLDAEPRIKCSDEMVRRNAPGFAIGGLSGGETKDELWHVIDNSAPLLPLDKPKYCMGVGYALDLIVLTALGVDMFDCVYPTRTARFGHALLLNGLTLNVNQGCYSADTRPIEPGCECACCANYTRAALHLLFRSNQSVAASILSIHNLFHQKRLMKEMRAAIMADNFPQWVIGYIKQNYGDKCDLPEWAANGLGKVGVDVRQFVGEEQHGKVERSTRHDVKKNKF